MSSDSMLNWPDGIERTPAREREAGTKFSTGYQETRGDLKDELRRMNANQYRVDSVSGNGDDPGIVLRWKKDGADYAVACDYYKTKTANLRCIYLWINETRMREQRPANTAQDSFAAAKLPPGDGSGDSSATTVGDGSLSVPPHEVLGVREDASETVVKASARKLKSKYHPDGDSPDKEQFIRVKRAEKVILDG